MSLRSMRPRYRHPKHLLAEVAIHGYKVFRVYKQTPTGRGGGSILYIKNTSNPIERKQSATCTRESIQVDINLKNAEYLKLALIYRNIRITAADDDEFYTMLEKFLLSQHEFVIMGDFNLPNIDWTLERPTPAPGNKLMQLLADNNLTQHVHETTRQNNILDPVISTEDELIVDLKIIDKIGDHQANHILNKNRKWKHIIKNYNFRKANFDAMRNGLIYQTFEQPVVRNNAELGFEIVKNTVNDASGRHIPKRRATINNPS